MRGAVALLPRCCSPLASAGWQQRSQRAWAHPCCCPVPRPSSSSCCCWCPPELHELTAHWVPGPPPLVLLRGRTGSQGHARCWLSQICTCLYQTSAGLTVELPIVCKVWF
jgi:hypothetical protein